MAAGIRRIEAIAGLRRYKDDLKKIVLIEKLAERLHSPVGELGKKLEATLTRQKELEKELEVFRLREAADLAKELLLKATSGTIPAIIEEIPNAEGNKLQSIADALRGNFEGIIFLASSSSGTVSLVAVVDKVHQTTLPAGKLISAVAPLVGGKGGGKPDSARGGGRDASGIPAVIAKARELIAVGKI